MNFLKILWNKQIPAGYLRLITAMFPFFNKVSPVKVLLSTNSWGDLLFFPLVFAKIIELFFRFKRNSNELD